MRMFRFLGMLVMRPENKADGFLLDCMTHKTKADRVDIVATDKDGRQVKGVLFCEYVKNRDAEFEEWPAEHFMTKIREGVKKRHRGN